MTAPTPGFPPELETAITEALVKHRMNPRTETTLHINCTCGKRLYTANHAVHQWAVIAEIIAQHTTTEWGYALPSFSPGFYARSESVEQVMEVQRLNPDIEVQIAFRPTFPWQEVKA
ncbi:hypothetical protein [Arthrobacter woluwensis]|uniref:hypothetical protein n=1 Tax=Arthrobacter woluwensis TaxID=156980 RepID=UPI0011AAFB7B|nr:hypothetical protein [Arthrobacter woluwensis]